MTKDRGMNEKYTRDFTYFVLLEEQSPRTTLSLVRGERIVLNGDCGWLGGCKAHSVGCVCFVYPEGSPGVTLNLLSDPEFLSSFWSLPFATGGLAYILTLVLPGILPKPRPTMGPGEEAEGNSRQGTQMSQAWNYLLAQC